VKSATAYPTCRHDAVLKRTIEAIRTERAGFGKQLMAHGRKTTTPMR
jgi:hypothetical protein